MKTRPRQAHSLGNLKKNMANEHLTASKTSRRARLPWLGKKTGCRGRLVNKRRPAPLPTLSPGKTSTVQPTAHSHTTTLFNPTVLLIRASSPWLALAQWQPFLFPVPHSLQPSLFRHRSQSLASTPRFTPNAPRPKQLPPAVAKQDASPLCTAGNPPRTRKNSPNSCPTHTCRKFNASAAACPLTAAPLEKQRT